MPGKIWVDGEDFAIVRVEAAPEYDLDYIDPEEKTLQPSTIPSGQKCYLCLRYNLLPMCPRRTLEEFGSRALHYKK